MNARTYTPLSIARALLRWLLRLLLVLLLIPGVAALSFVATRGLPAQPGLDAAMAPSPGPAPHLRMLRDIVWADAQGYMRLPSLPSWMNEPDVRLTGYLARLISMEGERPRSTLQRHLGDLAWQLSLNISYDRESITSLWSAKAFSPAGAGMEAAALHYFNRPLHELECHDLAALVVMVRAPRRFAPGSAASEERIRATGLEAACRQPMTDNAETP